jgi:hypothetical protein
MGEGCIMVPPVFRGRALDSGYRLCPAELMTAVFPPGSAFPYEGCRCGNVRSWRASRIMQLLAICTPVP